MSSRSSVRASTAYSAPTSRATFVRNSRAISTASITRHRPDPVQPQPRDGTEPAELFELANNHHWAAEFSITNWAVPAPAWMQIGRGSDSEREWTLYGFLTYYALLDCGFRLSPAVGTANGVHPVPLGFSRVYVHLPRGTEAEWIKRSAVSGNQSIWSLSCTRS